MKVTGEIKDHWDRKDHFWVSTSLESTSLLVCLVSIFYLILIIIHCRNYSGTPLNGHPSIVDTHDITDNSESPDCPPVHFNT